MEMTRAHLTISGLVQGVFFRANTVENAQPLNVCGWVKNNPDGSVEAVLEVDKESIEKVISWCRTGPPKARVDKVVVKWEKFKDEFDGFMALTRHTSY